MAAVFMFASVICAGQQTQAVDRTGAMDLGQRSRLAVLQCTTGNVGELLNSGVDALFRDLEHLAGTSDPAHDCSDRKCLLVRIHVLPEIIDAIREELTTDVRLFVSAEGVDGLTATLSCCCCSFP